MKEKNAIALHPEFLKKKGKIEFVVLPYEEFLAIQELIEDAEDVLDLRAAQQEEGGGPAVPLTEVKRDLDLQ